MKITKSKLKQIIKEEYDNLLEALPPHLQSKVDAYEKKKRKYSITDVTPAGYGPDEDEEEYTPGPEHHAAMQKAIDAIGMSSGDEEEEQLEE
jgi:hypothetical protein